LESSYAGKKVEKRGTAQTSRAGKDVVMSPRQGFEGTLKAVYVHFGVK